MIAVEEYATQRMAMVPRYRAGVGAVLTEGKLSSNESPYGPSPRVRAALAGAVDHVGRYDGGAETALAVAAHLGVPREQVVLTNGSDELCFLIGTVFLVGRPSVVVVSDPSYAIDVTVSLIAGSEVRRVPLRNGAHDVDGLVAASAGAHVLWLPVPHNPTGCGLTQSEVESLLSRVGEDCLVVLDEAYRGFVPEGQRIDSIGLVQRHPNLVLQRTFSKDYGMAGLRSGFGVGSPAVIGALEAARGPFAVNAVALAATRAGLESEAWRRMTADAAARERERFEAFLDEQGIEYLPSQANFVAVRVPFERIRDALEREGLSVRPGEDLGLPGWCRISMGLPAPMARMRHVLRETIGRSRG